METKYDQLEKLKQFLDSGTLSKEEFDAAKQRLLNSDPPSTPTAPESETSSVPIPTHPSLGKKKAIVAGVVALAIIILICIIVSGKTSTEAENAEVVPTEVVAEEYVEESVAPYAEELEYNGDPGTLLLNADDDEETKTDTQFGAWKKSYFRDDFGDTDYSKPFISMWVPGETFNVNLGILYRPSGSFALKLFDDDNDVRNIYSSEVDLAIRVNGKDIGPVKMAVEKNEIYFVGDDARFFSTVCNQGSFVLSISYESYGEEYHYLFNVKQAKGSFERAVPHLLGSACRGE